MQIKGVAISSILTTCNLHSHNAWEIILNMSGSGLEQVGDQMAPFGPGTITICPPGILHTKYCHENKEPWQDMCIRFTNETGNFHPARTWFEDDANHSIETILRILLGIYYDTTASQQAPIALLEAVLALILSWDQDSRQDKITERMKAEISFHFSDPEFSVMDVMRNMNYCPDHIRRVFRQDTGLTPTAYLTKVRLSHAAHLLQSITTPAYSIREIASLSGFYDSEYFCRVFHREYGLSPRAYRQQLPPHHPIPSIMPGK